LLAVGAEQRAEDQETVLWVLAVHFWLHEGQCKEIPERHGSHLRRSINSIHNTYTVSQKGSHQTFGNNSQILTDFQNYFTAE